MAPTLAGRWRAVLCWQSWALLIVGSSLCSAASQPHCSPRPWSPHPSPVFLAGVTTVFREPGKKCPFALKGVGRLLSSQVWTGVFQTLLFRCSAFSPTISRLYLHFPFPHQQHQHEAGQKKL